MRSFRIKIIRKEKNRKPLNKPSRCVKTRHRPTLPFFIPVIGSAPSSSVQDCHILPNRETLKFDEMWCALHLSLNFSLFILFTLGLSYCYCHIHLKLSCSLLSIDVLYSNLFNFFPPLPLLLLLVEKKLFFLFLYRQRTCLFPYSYKVEWVWDKIDKRVYQTQFLLIATCGFEHLLSSSFRRVPISQ